MATLLDWGCGDQHLLRKIKEENGDGNLKLFGYDKYTKPANESQPGHISFIGEERDIKSKKLNFDYVSIIHTLELITNLQSEISLILEVMKEDGKIFIQVPNLATSPFDLYVADHVSHFTPESLSNLLYSSGLEVLKVESRISQKEISVVAKRSSDVILKNPKSDGADVNNLQVKSRVFREFWERKLKGLYDKKGLAIYGIGVAGAWLHRLSRDLGIHIDFFIDDNEQTLSFVFNDTPIISFEALQQVTNVQTVLLPFETSISIRKSQELTRIGISAIFFNSDS
jgi:hypothetical protein